MQLRERRKNSSVYISGKQVGKYCTIIITDLLTKYIDVDRIFINPR